MLIHQETPLCEGFYNMLCNCSKSCWVVDGHFGEHLAVQRAAGLLEAVDEFAVRNTVEIGSNAKPVDPEASEIPFALFPSNIVVSHGLKNGVGCLTAVIFTVADISFGLFEQTFPFAITIDCIG